jgi:hypothetical protein
VASGEVGLVAEAERRCLVCIVGGGEVGFVGVIGSVTTLVVVSMPLGVAIEVPLVKVEVCLSLYLDSALDGPGLLLPLSPLPL